MARPLKSARRPRKSKTNHLFSVYKYSPKKKTLLTFLTLIMQKGNGAERNVAEFRNVSFSHRCFYVFFQMPPSVLTKDQSEL